MPLDGWKPILMEVGSMIICALRVTMRLMSVYADRYNL